MRFNDEVYARLSAMPTVTTVVLAGQWSNQIVGRVLLREGSALTVVDTNDRLVADALSQTVAKIRLLGKRVVIVEPPPSADFDPRRCNERLIEQVVTFGASRDCRIDRQVYEKMSLAMRAMIHDVETSSQVHIIRLASPLCGPTSCDTTWQSTILYQDAGHISYEGFAALAKRTNVLNEINNFAK